MLVGDVAPDTDASNCHASRVRGVEVLLPEKF